MFDGEYSAYWYNGLDHGIGGIDLIGIGILSTDRRNDLLPCFDAEHFMLFIGQELLPLIEKRFRVRNKILFGHSFGGATVLYSLLNHPALFDFYIMANDKPIMDMTERESFVNLDKSLYEVKGLFVGFGENDHRSVKKWNIRLISGLSFQEFRYLRWRSLVFPGVSHYDSERYTLSSGLEYYKQLLHAVER